MNKLYTAAAAMSLTVLAAAGMAAVSPAATAHAAANYQQCLRVENTKYDGNMAGNDSHFKVKDDTAYVKVSVNISENCDNVVSMAVWNAPNGTLDDYNINHQTLFAKNTWTDLADGSKVLHINLPADENGVCYYQLDVTNSTNPLGKSGTPWYPNEGNPQDKKFAWTFGGTHKCEVQPEQPEQPQQPQTPQTPQTPEQPQQPAQPQQPEQPQQPTQPKQPEKPAPKQSKEQPKELPNTGPGAVLGLFSGTSAAAGLGYNAVIRRRTRR
jgi:hypothetical protein